MPCGLQGRVEDQPARMEELVQPALHSTPGDLPATGCRATLQFPIPEDSRSPNTLWRDVVTQAVQLDSTPDPDHPNLLTLRAWTQPEGNLGPEVRDIRVTATHTALSLEAAWGTTVAVNDLAVRDILITTLGLELDVVNCLSQEGIRISD